MTSAMRLSVGAATAEHTTGAAEETAFAPVERQDGALGQLAVAGGPIVRLVGAVLLEQNEEWAVQRARYMTLEAIATRADDQALSLLAHRQLTCPAQAAER